MTTAFFIWSFCKNFDSRFQKSFFSGPVQFIERSYQVHPFAMMFIKNLELLVLLQEFNSPTSIWIWCYWFLNRFLVITKRNSRRWRKQYFHFSKNMVWVGSLISILFLTFLLCWNISEKKSSFYSIQ